MTAINKYLQYGSIGLSALALLGLLGTSLPNAQAQNANTNAGANVNAGGGYDTTGRSGLVQCGNQASDPCTVEDFFNIFVIATNILIGLVGLVAIFAIVFSGYSMVIAAGNTEAITKAKKNLTNAIIGLVLVLLAFILINTILYLVLGVKGQQGGVFNPIDYINGK